MAKINNKKGFLHFAQTFACALKGASVARNNKARSCLLALCLSRAARRHACMCLLWRTSHCCRLSGAESVQCEANWFTYTNLLLTKTITSKVTTVHKTFTIIKKKLRSRKKDKKRQRIRSQMRGPPKSKDNICQNEIVSGVVFACLSWSSNSSKNMKIKTFEKRKCKSWIRFLLSLV